MASNVLILGVLMLALLALLVGLGIGLAVGLLLGGRRGEPAPAEHVAPPDDGAPPSPPTGVSAAPDQPPLAASAAAPAVALEPPSPNISAPPPAPVAAGRSPGASNLSVALAIGVILFCCAAAFLIAALMRVPPR